MNITASFTGLLCADDFETRWLETEQPTHDGAEETAYILLHSEVPDVAAYLQEHRNTVIRVDGTIFLPLHDSEERESFDLVMEVTAVVWEDNL